MMERRIKEKLKSLYTRKPMFTSTNSHKSVIVAIHTQTNAGLFSYGLSCLARAKVQLSSSASDQVIIKHTMLQKIASCLPSLM